MATITKENIGLLHEKLTVKLEKTDYMPSFEKAIKDYSKKANIPGFRKGQVPPGLIRKMYGSSVFSDEVLRTVDRELVKYLETDKLDIFAQPLPLEINMRQLDMNHPDDYTFQFEVGMKPEFKLADLAAEPITRYNVQVTDEMINLEIERLQNRHGNMKDLDKVHTEDDVLNVVFTQADENGNPVEGGITKDNSLLVKYFKEDFRKNLMGKTINDFVIVDLLTAFAEKEREWIIGDLGLNKEDENAAGTEFKIQITKIGLLEKKELNEEFYTQLYPNQEIKTESDFRNRIREDIQAYWASQARNQIHDQAYHALLDHSEIKFPEGFLKKWMKMPQAEGEQTKTDDQVEAEFPAFINQLKWTLITDKIIRENSIHVDPEELRNFAKQQLLGYMGMNAGGEEQAWMNDYTEKMMKDRKYVEETYNRLQTQKIFEWAETQVRPADKEITAEEFTKLIEAHQHHHH
jgi:trigger factor